MRLAIEWLKKLINVPWSPEDLAGRLIKLGIGVEDFDNDILDLEISPNRGDLLSVLGVAREVSTISGKKITYPKSDPLPSSKLPLTITIVNKDLVPRYTAAVIEGVSIMPTKNEKIIRRLKSMGMRPINNLVDITNYVMLETGLPSHAFDVGKISGHSMTIRQAKSGETLKTLDGANRELPEGSIVIEDARQVIDLAGIMGGESSSIGENTNTVLLQAAVFNPALIRRASKTLKISTEASYRFERYVDPGATLEVLKRLVSLIKEEAGGEIRGILDEKNLPARKLIELPHASIARLVGQNYPEEVVMETLTQLGCTVNAKGETYYVTPPSWRHDLTIAEDLIEEIVRVAGYDTIKSQPLPAKLTPPSDDYLRRESLKNLLLGKGLSEVTTYSLFSASDLAVTPVKEEAAVKIANPLSEELKFFRSDLLPGLLKVVAKNPTYDPIRVFEIGHVATREREWVQVGIVFAGRGTEELSQVAQELGLPVKKVSDQQLARYKIRKKEIMSAIGDWEAVKPHITPTNRLVMPTRVAIKPLSKFPSVARDVSIIVDRIIRNDEIKMAIAGVSEYIHLVEIFDEYESPKLGRDKKSLAFHIYYQHPEKTLTAEEVSKLHQLVEGLLEKEFQASIR